MFKIEAKESDNIWFQTQLFWMESKMGLFSETHARSWIRIYPAFYFLQRIQIRICIQALPRIEILIFKLINYLILNLKRMTFILFNAYATYLCCGSGSKNTNRSVGPGSAALPKRLKLCNHDYWMAFCPVELE